MQADKLIDQYKTTKNLKAKPPISKLVKGCKNCDREAQKQLYLKYADDMMTVAIRYTRDLSSAKDLVHNAFLKVYKTIGQYDERKGTLGGWMRQILINEALQSIRKQGRMVISTEEVFMNEQATDLTIIQKLEAEDILNLLQKLPEGCRVIFNLHVIEGYKHQEISQMLGITASASRSQLTRAKKLLRSLLSEKKKNIRIQPQNGRAVKEKII